MKVKAEIRDMSYKKMLWKTLVPIIVEPVLLLFTIIACNTVKDSDLARILMIASIFLGVFYVVLLIWSFIKANKAYKSTWLTNEYDFTAKDGRLTLNNKPMHVNVYKKRKVMYVHDLGDDGGMYDATFYGTVTGTDFELLLKYMDDNGIKPERENLPKSSGKYGYAAPYIVNKYRRR